MNFERYSPVPSYNINAVVKLTGVRASTLRAWERRYAIFKPSRSQNNYRLYSDRDVAMLQWLDQQVQSGMSISSAVHLLAQLLQPLLDIEQQNATESIGANVIVLRDQLAEALIQLDESRSNALLAQAMALFSLEDVSLNIVAPTLRKIGDDWHRGAVNIATEHFASAFLLGKLQSIMNAHEINSKDLIFVCCAPGERHEIGALMFAMLLRKHSFNARYLSADLPFHDLLDTIHAFQPRAVAISALQANCAQQLADFPEQVNHVAVETQLVFGGRGFAEMRFAYAQNVAYVGEDMLQAIQCIHEIMDSTTPALWRSLPDAGRE